MAGEPPGAATRRAWEATDRGIGAAARRLSAAEREPGLPRRVRNRLARRFAALGQPARPEAPGPRRFSAACPRRASVSVVLPTAGATGIVDGVERCYVTELLGPLVRSLGGTDELVVVVGEEVPDGVVESLRSAERSEDRVGVVVEPGPFSFSARVNRGVAASRSEVVVLLNDDTEILDPDWLGPMARAACSAGVGAVGATLLHEDGSLQHAGLTTVGGLPTHAWSGWDPSEEVDREVRSMDRLAWGVTGAALAVTRRSWDLLGGFSNDFPVNYNDVDFCCKAGHMGLVNVVLASVRLRHFESRSRRRELPAADVEALRDRWTHRLGPDPLVAGTSALEVHHGGAGHGDGSGRS